MSSAGFAFHDMRRTPPAHIAFGPFRFDPVNETLTRDGRPDLTPPSGPADVCDGGPRFFGAEWEPATGRVTHIAFNGSV